MTDHNLIQSEMTADSQRLDKLVNLSGELVTIRSQFSQVLKLLEKDIQEGEVSNVLDVHVRQLNDLTTTLGKISSHIQSDVMQIRMLPLDEIFIKCKNIFGDVSLEISGAETELDKVIVDCLDSSVIKIAAAVKNHISASKEKPHDVGLKAEQKGNIIYVSFEWLNALFSKDEQGDIIFDIEGGLELIKDQLAQINSSIEIIQEEDITKINLEIPLSLSIFQSLLVMVSNQVYAIPIDSVVEIIKTTPNDIYLVDGNETVKLRGHALDLVDLRDVMQMEREGVSQTNKIVVIKDHDIQIGIKVDSLIGEEEIVMKPLPEHFLDVKGVSGVTILGDGCIALILASDAIIKSAQ